MTATNPGKHGFVAWWTLEDLYDDHGANHLTADGTLDYPAGKVGNCVNIDASYAPQVTPPGYIPVTCEGAYITDNAALSAGDIEFTIGCWVKFDAFQTGKLNGDYSDIINKLDNTSNIEYALVIYHTSSTTARARFYACASGGNSYVEASVDLSLDTWYFILAWHDPSANYIYIQVNNGTVYSTAHAHGIRDGSCTFWLGNRSGAYHDHFGLNGKVDEAFVAKRLLTADEREWLYNSGSGRTLSALVLDLTVQDASHSHAADNVALSGATTLTVADATHGHEADNVTLVSDSTLVVQDAEHGHEADNVTLICIWDLEVQDAEHGHAADNVTLASASTLVVQDAEHGHAADNVTLVYVRNLEVQDAEHGHAADNVTLVSDITLAVQDAEHGHAADNVSLVYVNVLIVSSCVHHHVADLIDLLSIATSSILIVDDRLAQMKAGERIGLYHAERRVDEYEVRRRGVLFEVP